MRGATSTLIAAALVLTLVGCGGGEEAPPPTEPSQRQPQAEPAQPDARPRTGRCGKVRVGGFTRAVVTARGVECPEARRVVRAWERTDPCGASGCKTVKVGNFTCRIQGGSTAVARWRCTRPPDELVRFSFGD